MRNLNRFSKISQLRRWVWWAWVLSYRFTTINTLEPVWYNLPVSRALGTPFFVCGHHVKFLKTQISYTYDKEVSFFTKFNFKIHMSPKGSRVLIEYDGSKFWSAARTLKWDISNRFSKIPQLRRWFWWIYLVYVIAFDIVPFAFQNVQWLITSVDTSKCTQRKITMTLFTWFLASILLIIFIKNTFVLNKKRPFDPYTQTVLS